MKDNMKKEGNKRKEEKWDHLDENEKAQLRKYEKKRRKYMTKKTTFEKEVNKWENENCDNLDVNVVEHFKKEDNKRKNEKSDHLDDNEK